MVSKYEFPPPDTSVKTEDVKINDYLTVRIYSPPNATGSDNLAIYFHGGGWAMGDLNIEDAQCRIISKGCNIIVVSVDYRLAPKHKYPAGLEDCVEASKWALKNRTAIGANKDPVALAGTSAGGGLAFSVAMKLLVDGLGGQIAGVAALVPVTIHPDAVPSDLQHKYTSYDEHAEHTVNTKDAMLAFFGWSRPKKREIIADKLLDAYEGKPLDKFVSPLLHKNILNGLKRVYMTECGADTLRDDARLMKENLESLQ